MKEQIFRRHVDLDPPADVVDSAALGEIVGQCPRAELGQRAEIGDFDPLFKDY